MVSGQGLRQRVDRAPCRGEQCERDPRDAQHARSLHGAIRTRTTFRALNKEFWGRHLWARGYFVATSGNVTDEVIKKYIELQGAEPQNDDKFRISG